MRFTLIAPLDFEGHLFSVASRNRHPHQTVATTLLGSSLQRWRHPKPSNSIPVHTARDLWITALPLCAALSGLTETGREGELA
eukprot:3085348-Rhodomonas_salina.1